MFKLFLKNLLYKQPLSLRGALALMLSYLALAKYAIPENDLVAYILGGAGLLLLTCLLPILFLQRFILPKKIKAQVLIDTKNLFSKTNIASGISISGAALTTLFILKIERVFSKPGARSARHLIKGKTPGKNSKRQLVDSVYFPHRGLWNLSHLELTIADAFGLTRLRWNHKISEQFEISAKPVSIEPLPLVISSAQAGDQLNQNVERAGDLYDIKAYDPSDGTKHILWKTYARSRQLVVRRPEQAVIPEGEVALYLIAEKEDDDLAAALLDYAKQLNERNIVTFFSTDGLAGEIVERLDKINTSINESVWYRAVGSGSELEVYLENLIAKKNNIREILVFAKATAQVANRLVNASHRYQIIISTSIFAEDNSSLTFEKQLQDVGIRVLRCRRET